MATSLIQIKPGTPIKMDTDDKPTFQEWLARVDKILSRNVGMESADLPDCTYSKWYEQRLRPIRAAQRAIKNCGEF